MGRKAEYEAISNNVGAAGYPAQQIVYPASPTLRVSVNHLLKVLSRLNTFHVDLDKVYGMTQHDPT